MFGDLLAVALLIWVGWRFCVRPLLEWMVLEGYEDEAGFHYGREP